MKEKRKILLTFDYELFLGKRSGTVEQSLLTPTRLVLKLLETYGLKNAIFFIDTAWIYRMQGQAACEADLAQVSDQLRVISKNGHYIFPHFHPHWLDAKYLPEINQWGLEDLTKYRFHHATPEERSLLFTHAGTLLAGITGNKAEDFAMTGYRAGGWSIQPFSDFREHFLRHGITHEFTVAKGFSNLSEAQYFDFTSCPDADIYRFEMDPTKEKTDGPFREYTISSIQLSNTMQLLNRLWNKYLWKTGVRSVGDGLSVAVGEENKITKKRGSRNDQSRQMLSIESLTLPLLPLYKKFIDDHSYSHFISHPKMLSTHNFRCFDKMLRHITGKYDLQTNFQQF
jgi:hypothetical protein